jgi:2-pyrone-4,6-dicarboxylate lactonase
MPILTQGPDPAPKTPKFRCPPGTIDSHIHLFGPAEKYGFDPSTFYTSRDALPETNIALQQTLGVSRAVIVSGGAYGRNPTHLADTLARFPERFRGIALMPEDTPAPPSSSGSASSACAACGS